MKITNLSTVTFQRWKFPRKLGTFSYLIRTPNTTFSTQSARMANLGLKERISYFTFCGGIAKNYICMSSGRSGPTDLRKKRENRRKIRLCRGVLLLWNYAYKFVSLDRSNLRGGPGHLQLGRTYFLIELNQLLYVSLARSLPLCPFFRSS